MPEAKLFTYDKLGHTVIFLVQAYLFVSGIFFDKKNVTNSIVWGLLITVTYAALIEIGQEYIPDRGMELYDMIANCVGSVTGVTLFYISYKMNWQ